MIAIIDYDAGNIMSVQKACSSLGYATIVTRNREDLLAADHVILPGVGAFGDAMDKLTGFGLDRTIRDLVATGTPFLGICLGLQLLFERSEEALQIGGKEEVKGLGLLEGEIFRFDDEGGRRKVPHMGWNTLSFPRGSRLYQGIPEDTYVYFVHSYYLRAKDPSLVTATCRYGNSFDASVEKGNLYACQFHPEKSGRWGLKILDNFLRVSG